MVQTEREDTEFRNYSTATENLFFLRRGRLKILISVEKGMQAISIDEKQARPDISEEGLQVMISTLGTLGKEE